MRAIVAVAVVVILVSIVAVSTLTGNIDARTRGSDSVAAGTLERKVQDLECTAPCVVQMQHMHAKRYSII